jgi:PAS domain S-box-containing protein
METLLWIVVLASGCAAVALAVGLVAARRRLRAAEQLLQQERAARRAAEAGLDENRARLRTIIETEPECVKLQSHDGTILEMNPAGLAYTEADVPEQIVGQSVYPLIAPEDRVRYRALTDAVFEGRPATLEFRLISMKGRERIMETHAVPLRNGEGEITALLGLTRDITERRHAEEQARRHQAELARVTRLSTVGELASGVAHELNQPLAAIANHAAACQRRAAQLDALPPAMVESLDEICAQARRAGQIIRNIRELVKKGAPKRAVVDINGVVQTVARLVEPEARQRGVEVDTRLDARLPPVSADRIELEQVLLNLVKNSIEAMQGTDVARRKVRLATSCNSQGRVAVQVHDTGPGIPGRLLDEVFNPFFTTKADGMGMGLSISKSIAEAHGGELRVHRSGGRGTTFELSLPACADVAAAAA